MQPRLAIGDLVAPTLLGEQFAVCNNGGTGIFDIFEDGAETATRTLPILDGTCAVVASLPWPYNPPGVYGHSVRVVGRVPLFWRVSSAHVQVGHEAGLYPHSSTVHAAEVRVDQLFPAGTNEVTGPIHGGRPTPDEFLGSLATFTIGPIPPGTQACALRFWRLTPARWVGYWPRELFLNAFGVNAFPDKSLFWLLNMDAGGLIGLGREAVVALLNSSNGAVNYGMTPSEVIQVFRATYGQPALYDGVRLQFAARNAQGPCPF